VYKLFGVNMKKPFVSVVVCTRNRPDDLRECLASLKKQGYLKFEIIVVDNGDDKRTAEVAEKMSVRYVPAPLKPNLPYARNVGLEASKGEIVVYCDDDIIAEDGWLPSLISAYSEGVGAVGGKVLVPETSGLMEEELEKAKGLKKAVLGFLAFLIDYRGRGKVTNTGQVTGFYGITSVQEVDHMQGCNMSYRKVLLEKIGGFDEMFGIGYPFRDDTDASVRVKKTGQKIIFVPEASVFHKLSKTDPKFYRRNYYYRNCEHIYFVFKNSLIHGSGYLKFPVQQMADILIYAALALRERNPSVFTATVMGKLAGFALVLRSKKTL